MLAEDAVPLKTVGEAEVNASRCLIGEPGTIVHSKTSLEMEDGDGFAYVGVEVQGLSRVRVSDSTVQLTQIAGVRVSEDATVEIDRCRLLHTGCMGGAGLCPFLLMVSDVVFAVVAGRS